MITIVKRDLEVDGKMLRVHVAVRYEPYHDLEALIAKAVTSPTGGATARNGTVSVTVLDKHPVNA